MMDVWRFPGIERPPRGLRNFWGPLVVGLRAEINRSGVHLLPERIYFVEALVVSVYRMGIGLKDFVVIFFQSFVVLLEVFCIRVEKLALTPLRFDLSAVDRLALVDRHLLFRQRRIERRDVRRGWLYRDAMKSAPRIGEFDLA